MIKVLNTRWIIILFTLLISLNIQSQNSKVKVWNLDKCIKFGLENNLDLETQKMNVSLSKSVLRQTRYNFIPTLNARATHEYNWGQRIDPFTNTFATKRVQSNNFYLSSSVTLFSGLHNYYLKQQATSDIKIQSYQVDIQKRNLKIEIISNYLQILLNQEILKSYIEKLNQTEKQKSRIEILINSGRITKFSLTEIEAQIALDSFNIIKSQSDIEISILRLKQIINLSDSESFETEQPIDKENKLLEKEEVVIVNLVEIKQIEEQILKNELERKIAKSAIYPSLTLNGSVGSGYSGNNTKLNDNGELTPKLFDKQLDENLYQTVALTLNIPIFNNNRTKLAIEKAKITRLKTEINRKRITRDLQNKVSQLKIEIKNEKFQLLSAMKALKSSETVLENAQLKYRNGIINFITFNEFSTKLFLAKSNYIQVKYNLFFKQKLLQQYSK